MTRTLRKFSRLDRSYWASASWTVENFDRVAQQVACLLELRILGESSEILAVLFGLRDPRKVRDVDGRKRDGPQLVEVLGTPATALPRHVVPNLLVELRLGIVRARPRAHWCSRAQFVFPPQCAKLLVGRSGGSSYGISRQDAQP